VEARFKTACTRVGRDPSEACCYRLRLPRLQFVQQFVILYSQMADAVLSVPIGTGRDVSPALGCRQSHPLRLKMMKRTKARMMMIRAEAMKPPAVPKPG
jgi:hypothetical protein